MATGTIARQRADERRRGLALCCLTIAWMVVAAGWAAVRSLSLVGVSDLAFHGFGAAVAIRQLRRPAGAPERDSVRLVGLSLLVLASYAALDGTVRLATGTRALEGPGVAVLTYLVVMTGLGLGKRRTGRRLGSATLVTDSTGTLVCAGLSGAMALEGFLAAALGWWQVGPLAGLALAAVAGRQGRAAWLGRRAATPSPVHAG